MRSMHGEQHNGAKKMKELRILYDDDSPDVTLLDSEGNERHFRGVVIFAGDGFAGSTFVFAHGCSADAALSFARSYGIPGLTAFYKSAAFQLLSHIDPRLLMAEASISDVLARWESEEGKAN